MRVLDLAPCRPTEGDDLGPPGPRFCRVGSFQRIRQPLCASGCHAIGDRTILRLIWDSGDLGLKVGQLYGHRWLRLCPHVIVLRVVKLAVRVPMLRLGSGIEETLLEKLAYPGWIILAVLVQGVIRCSRGATTSARQR